MADIIAFRPRVSVTEDVDDIDILTAVDAAIRDLRDISAAGEGIDRRARAEECLEMLEKAFRAAR